MTEAEWLASDDPQAMLRYARGLVRGVTYDNPTIDAGVRVVSDRKLRLFACACVRQVWHMMTDDRGRRAVTAGEARADDDSMEGKRIRGLAFNAADQLRGEQQSLAYGCLRADPVAGAREASFHARQAGASSSVQAAILRDIVGTPHRPVTLPDGGPCPSCRGDGGGFVGDNINTPTDWWDCPDCGGSGRRACPWLTPDVVALANAAYDERERECEACGGTGYDRYRDSCVEKSRCFKCHGTGRIEDGTLDPVRLSILADALTDAGCPATSPCPCRREWSGKWADLESDDVGLYGGRWKVKKKCQLCKEAGEIPNPLVPHLRSPQPHYRGCHVVDLLLGKQ